MSNLTTTGNFLSDGMRRGDYICLWRGTPGISDDARVVRATATTLTTRASHRLRAVEWLHARAEDWFLWPLSDLKQKIHVKPDA